jgi:hypothetical protein
MVVMYSKKLLKNSQIGITFALDPIDSQSYNSKKQRIDASIVYRLDRISRNTGDFSKLMEDLNQREICFICELFDWEKHRITQTKNDKATECRNCYE